MWRPSGRPQPTGRAGKRQRNRHSTRSATFAYTVVMASPSSVRFDPAVAARLSRFVAAHSGLSASAATNMLVDEALRSEEHPLVIFRDGPAGRRARLVGGPDVWEVASVVRSARDAEPDLAADAVVDLVSETSGVAPRLVHAALSYWAAYPAEIDGWIERAQAEAIEAEQRWQREQDLLGR